MDEVPTAAELANFFMAAVSIIFGVWHDKVEEVLATKRPLAYAERGPYAQYIFSTILSRSAPICILIGSFVIAFAPTTIHLLRTHSLGLSDRVDAVTTVYCLMFWFLSYLFLISVYQFGRLVRKLLHSGQGREKSQPRASWL